MQHRSVEKFHDLLFAVLSELGGINLAEHKRSGTKKLLWTEIIENIARRNRVLHRCEPATNAEASHAINLATEVLERLFPTLIERISLHLHDGYRVCNKFHPPPDISDYRF